MQRAINGSTLVAVILALLELIEEQTGWKSGITEHWIIDSLAILAPIFAWIGGRGFWFWRRIP